eukprot:CAMPEP_0172637744 /NCGR_PEP_ID=MMETSP1068-20121228/210489_1 /TAXON_ID=35684 /ORGANISM="Pseudopedinella elastica, Strain CCMP716" /LENGTH=58 /DNA_ID=CAMNT_0013450477 /DNA_START=33 /DNA_END=206 /DNA_ORIENTATION=-
MGRLFSQPLLRLGDRPGPGAARGRAQVAGLAQLHRARKEARPIEPGRLAAAPLLRWAR